MILELSQGNRGWIFAGAEGALALVIGAGVAGLCSGGVALFVPKGSPLPAVAGRAFRVSMFAMSGVGAAAALGVAAAGVELSGAAASGAAHVIDGELALCFFLYLLVGATAAALDIRAMLQGGADGVHRLARQVWRLCVALFLAAGSYFLGQQRLLPALLRGTPLLIIPVFAPLAVASFWLLRARLAPMLGRPADVRTVTMAERAA